MTIYMRGRTSQIQPKIKAMTDKRRCQRIVSMSSRLLCGKNPPKKSQRSVFQLELMYAVGGKKSPLTQF